MNAEAGSPAPKPTLEHRAANDGSEPKPTAEDRAFPSVCGISGTATEVRSVPFIALQASPLYRMGKVPGTCRLPTRVTVKPGARRHLTLEAFRRWVMQAPLPIRNASLEE